MIPMLSSRIVPYSAVRDRWFIPGGVAALLLLLDQITKVLIVQTLGPVPGSQQVVLLNDWLSLVYVRNTGIAFGLLRDLSGIFTLVSLLICAVVIYAYLFYLPNQRVWVKISIGLILGGALGNIVDRLRLEYVVDFIKISWWPTFNLADTGITLGVLMLALYLLVGNIDIDDLPVDTHAHDEALLRELLALEPVASKEEDTRE